jgi:hypothetical protein
MPPLQESSPRATDWKTFGLMAVIYAIPTTILRLNTDDNFNYGLAGLGVVSYIFVEGASLTRKVRSSYQLPRDEEGYRADYEFVAYATKALAGVLFSGAAFGDVQVARMVPFILGASFII